MKTPDSSNIYWLAAELPRQKQSTFGESNSLSRNTCCRWIAQLERRSLIVRPLIIMCESACRWGIHAWSVHSARRHGLSRFFSSSKESRASHLSKAETKTIYLSYLIYVNAQTSRVGLSLSMAGRRMHSISFSTPLPGVGRRTPNWFKTFWWDDVDRQRRAINYENAPFYDRMVSTRARSDPVSLCRDRPLAIFGVALRMTKPENGF